MTLILILALLLVPAARPQPFAGYFGITNAASYYSEEGPGGTIVGEIAQGSVFVIAGRSLGPAEAQVAWDSPQPVLAGTSIAVTIADTTRHAAIVYSSERLVAGILPPDIPSGAGTVSVAYLGETTSPVIVRVTQRSFGIFAKEGRGAGPAVAYNISPEGELRLNTFRNASRPGQRMVLWGTGLGQQQSNPEVLVGDKTASAVSKPAACCRGIDQIEFEVPTGVEGCFVPVSVRFADGDVSRNSATISIAPEGGDCSDPHNLPASELQHLQDGQTVNRGWIQVREYQGFTHVTGSFSPIHDFFQGTRELPPFGSCIETRLGLYAPFHVITPPVSQPARPRLDAGNAFSLRTPQGIFEVSRLPGLFYSQPWPPGLPWRGGEYSVDNGAGGSEVGPFQASITVPGEPVVWTNQWDGRPISVDRDLNVTWRGGDPPRDYVVIWGTAEFSAAAVNFVCTERSAKGNFSIPSRVLRSLKRGSLPQPTWWSDGGWEATLGVSWRSFPVAFQARGLDSGALYYFNDSGMTLPIE